MMDVKMERNEEMRVLRRYLGLTQKQLAKVLGYGHKIRVSEFDRPTNPVPVPEHIRECLWDMCLDPTFWPEDRIVRGYEAKT